MIIIIKSKTADTRSCDYKTVSKETLKQSSVQHIQDVGRALGFFASKLTEAASVHDFDKLTEIDWFHSDFKTGFEKTEWWDNHRKVNRHHLLQEDGIPEDVNLIDVLELISDCTMAGMARTGDVFPLEISSDLLQKAFENTCKLLKDNVMVADIQIGQS